MLMIPHTTDRVPQHTDPKVNRAIAQQTAMNVRCYALAGRDAIDARLEELDEEWDIERVLEANAATASLLGMFLGTTRSKGWFLLPTVVSGFLLQHAVQGWCPPMAWFRRMGVRTQAEIELERDALRAVRGDFEDLPVHEDNDRIDIDQTLDILRQRQRPQGGHTTSSES